MYTAAESDQARLLFESISEAAGAIYADLEVSPIRDEESGIIVPERAERALRRMIRERKGYTFDSSWRGRFLLATLFGFRPDEVWPMVQLTDDRRTSTSELTRILNENHRKLYHPVHRTTLFGRLTDIAYHRARLSSPRPVWDASYHDGQPLFAYQ